MPFRPWLFRAFLCVAPAFLSASCSATVFSSLQGVIHDAQHFPVAGATVTVHAAASDFELKTATHADGEFELPSVPIGTYRIHVEAAGFAPQDDVLTLLSGTNPVLHFALAVEGAKTTVTVAESSEPIDSATSTTLVSRLDIEQTPGASRTLGMEMITNFVPGSYMTHDMLHMRGGHQTSWLLDGVSIPNTKIASNVGPQIDPKDIDQLEIQRGSYDSELGDRTYGVFNVLTRSGFERDRDAELTVMAGNFYTGETQLSLGNHSAKTAWYASGTGSRSNYGLGTPVANVYHDATNSQSGFVNLLRNRAARGTSQDQFRLTGQFRQDHFQVPYDNSNADYEYTSGYYDSYGLRDAQTERDGFAIANWVHTFSPRAVMQIAPFYHFNVSNYDSLPTDPTVATTWHQQSNYLGAQTDFHTDALKRNTISVGLYSFWQRENDLFGFQVNDGSAQSEPNTTGIADAGLVEFYFNDHVRIHRYIALEGGMRFSIFRSTLNETAAYPRIGATVEVPRLHWVFRGFYGHFFQPAPLETVSSSVLDYANQQQGGENTFTPLKSERDEEHQFGVQIPYKGWMLDIANVKNRVNNFLDHSNLGESNMYFPIAVDGALVRAWEMTLRSPELARLGQFHLTYSNQIAEQRGNIVGGFTCSIPADPACDLGPDYGPVDHDQRNTLNTGFTANLDPLQLRRTWFSTNVYYGSGFHNGLASANVGPYNANYLPVHTTFDISGGHAFGERWNLAGSVLNVTNHRVLLDNSVTIGGFHFNDPRILSATLKYRFKF